MGRGLAVSLDVIMVESLVWFSWVAVSLTHQNISKGRRLLDNTDMSLLKHSAVNLLDQEAGERCCLSDSPADL